MKTKPTPDARKRGSARRGALLIALALLVPMTSLTLAAEDETQFNYADDETIGIDEKLGEVIPLDLSFTDESGRQVTLGELIEKPTILTLVYTRCPGICSPLLEELTKTLDSERFDLSPGEDFQLVTVSFDVTDDVPTIRNAKNKVLGWLENKEIPEDSWHFLVGGPEQISSLTDAVGFRYRRENSEFVHAATVVFLSPEGKIVRYLPGLSLLPADVKMAVFDAAEGTPHSMMQRIQRLCYAYDPEGRSYALQVNRIILGITLPLVAIFLGYLLLKKKQPVTGS